MRFAYRQAANGVTWKIEVEKLPRALPAQIGKGSALHNAELPLRKLAIAPGAFQEVVARATRPTRRSRHRGLRRFTWRGRLDAFVQHHGDIRPKRKLNFRGFLRRQEMLGAIEMRTKAHPLVVNFAQLGEAINLVAAGIGENRARPGHEPVQPAQPAHQLVPGPQIQMIRIGEEDGRAELLEGLLPQTLDRGLRPYLYERWRVHRAMWRLKHAAARACRIRGFEGE